MKIKKSEETLILTQTEKAILSKAYDILDEIYDECEEGGNIENYADEAKDYLEGLLEEAEVENGEPHGAVNVIITM